MKKISILILMILLITISACSNKNNIKVQESNVFSNDIFSVSIPDDILKLCSIESADNQISFKHTESILNGFPGLVFTISAFENMDEWGNAEKMGELKTNDGKLYDIVMSYPSEFQTGTSDIPDGYKKIFDKRYDIASTTTGVNGGLIDTKAGKDGSILYKDVIDKYKKAFSEKWDSERLNAENMSIIYEKENYEGFGYAYYDIDKDMIDELVIGKVKYVGEKNKIYDIYKIVDRKVSHAIGGYITDEPKVDSFYTLSNYCFICNEIVEEGKDIYKIYNPEYNSTGMTFQLAFCEEINEENGEKLYSIAYNENVSGPEWVEVSEDDYNEMKNRFNEVNINMSKF